MLYNAEALGIFWRSAEARMPLVIVGGGRWGRVWASVVSQARGTSSDIVMVTRKHPHDLQAWLASREALRGIRIAGTVEEAFSLVPAKIAIVASHPRDHVADALSALDHSAHILVEKPLSDDPSAARELVSAASNADRVLAIGTEFAFLPALHQCVRLLGSKCESQVNISLRWDDPSEEVRHGAIKTRHMDVPLLADLLPHAISIFRIFDASPLQLVASHDDLDALVGKLVLSGSAGRRYELLCNARSDCRRRIVEITSGCHTARVEFSGDLPTIQIDGTDYPLDMRLLRFTSTLRLELGAFLSDISGCQPATPITASVPEHIRLADDLTMTYERTGSGRPRHRI